MHIRTRNSRRRVNGKPLKRYEATWIEDGTRHTETFDTREAAQNKLDDVKTLLSKGQSPANLRELGSATFADVAAQWLASRHDLKPRTRAEYTNLLADKTRARRTRSGESTADLSIASTFGHRPVNEIRRADVADWVGALTKAGKSVSTVRHHYFVVRQVLSQCVADGRLMANPTDHVKLPTERNLSGGTPGVVDDPSQFLTAAQVGALVSATPWPCAVVVHLAAWSGLRAAELAGLCIGDIAWPVNPNGTVWLSVERTVIESGGGLVYDTTKTKGSERRVPLTAATADMLRDYLAGHPRRDEPTAPLFCAVTLKPSKPTGKRASEQPLTAAVKAQRQATALADLSVDEAAARLVLDWSGLLRHQSFYKSVFRPAVLRSNRLAGDTVIPTEITFHSLRHTYASLCVAAGIGADKLSRRLGHAKITTTLDIYTHLFPDDDASGDMAALEAMSQPTAPNVVPMRRRG
ncbi:tyrosine-type recombinase/integrase [Mycobacterium sp. Z3061]|uniref:tyrosine-type recombinase/integrase n=1 Tax=Mycobacterium sp. Z3061 TaxID=3073562 RepID=UPI0028736BC5|nr:tyrosine-type recombinase/integrase [Mycobacterium sp. Z3061]